MINTTLCYITRGDQVLMLHRVKKENDINKDKWIGIGGKFEDGESPEECLLREAKEETGLTLTSWRCRGVVTFLNDCCEGEYMYLFTADGFEGTLKPCDEGDLQWVSRDFLDRLPKWEGDKIFLDLLWQDAPFFLLTLRYSGDQLKAAILNVNALPVSGSAFWFALNMGIIRTGRSAENRSTADFSAKHCLHPASAPYPQAGGKYCRPWDPAGGYFRFSVRIHSTRPSLHRYG